MCIISLVIFVGLVLPRVLKVGPAGGREGGGCCLSAPDTVLVFRSGAPWTPPPPILSSSTSPPRDMHTWSPYHAHRSPMTCRQAPVTCLNGTVTHTSPNNLDHSMGAPHPPPLSSGQQQGPVVLGQRRCSPPKPADTRGQSMRPMGVPPPCDSVIRWLPDQAPDSHPFPLRQVHQAIVACSAVGPVLLVPPPPPPSLVLVLLQHNTPRQCSAPVPAGPALEVPRRWW